MAKKLTSVLGIDIGSQKIKVCEIKSQGRDPVVTALGMIDTPEGAVDHSGIYNSDAVGLALKQVLNETGATTPHAVVTIAGQASVLVRTLEVPKMNPAELKEHMQWEINRNIPFAESTVVSDFKSLGGDDPASPNMDVVMAIAPQSAIDTVVSCMKKAGRQVAAIDVEPLSLARSLQSSYDDLAGNKTVCLVEVGAKTTSINIFKGAKLLMPRQVPIGGELFTKAIADALGISVSEAEVLKREKLDIPETAADAGSVANPFEVPGTTQGFQPYNPFSDDPAPSGFVPPAPEPAASTGYGTNPFESAPAPTYEPAYGGNPFGTDPIPEAGDATSAVVPVTPPSEAARLHNAVAPVLDEFMAEIRRSIDYFRSRGGEVDTVYLCGGGSKLTGLIPFLTKSLGLPCDAYDPFRRLNSNLRKVAPTFVEEHKADFAIALGNGLHIFFD